MNRTVKLAIGAAIVGFGVLLSVWPIATAGILGIKPHLEPTQWINLRASYGGTLVGLGLFIVWFPAMKPWKRTITGLLMWAMAGIGAARLLGFAIDGSPDSRQWIWLIAEIIIVITCAILLRRWARVTSA